jgi:hypothetical protein
MSMTPLRRLSLVLASGALGSVACAQSITLDSFESGTPGLFPPAGWEVRLPGGGGGLAASRCFDGAKSLKMVAQPFSACEVHTLWTAQPIRGGGATLAFSLMLSSETLSTGNCADLSVVFQGQNGSFGAGFQRQAATGPFYIAGTSTQVQPDRWYHFLVVADYHQNRRNYSVYVDGAQISTGRPLVPGPTPDRQNRVELHAGCIDSGALTGYFDAVSFTAMEPCPVDFDNSGLVNVNDFISFLNAAAVGCP